MSVDQCVFWNRYRTARLSSQGPVTVHPDYITTFCQQFDLNHARAAPERSKYGSPYGDARLLKPSNSLSSNTPRSIHTEARGNSQQREPVAV